MEAEDAYQRQLAKKLGLKGSAAAAVRTRAQPSGDDDDGGSSISGSEDDDSDMLPDSDSETEGTSCLGLGRCPAVWSCTANLVRRL